MKEKLKRIFFVIFAIIVVLVSVLSARAFVINDKELNISAYVGYEEKKPITIFNNQSFRIYNVSCTNTDEFKYQSLSDLFPYEQRNLNITYKTNEQYSLTQKQQTCFYFLPIETIKTPKNVTINLNSQGWITGQVNLYQDDILIINNTIDNSRTIQEINFNQYSQNLNGNSFITFSNTGIATYRLRDSFSSQVLYVNISNRTVVELVHNQVNDRQFQINIESLFKKTNVSFQIFTTNMTIDYDQTKEGTGRIINTGDFPAVNVQLLANDWIDTFNVNNFSLNKNEEKIFTFQIRPKGIKSSQQTNITYKIPFKVLARNIDEQNQTIDVFLNYKDVSLIETNGSNIQRIADTFTTKAMCVKEPMGTEFKEHCIKMSIEILNSTGDINKYVKSYVIREEGYCPVNLSKDQMSKIVEGISTQSDRENRLINVLKDSYLDTFKLNNQTKESSTICLAILSNVTSENEILKNKVDEAKQQALESELVVIILAIIFAVFSDKIRERINRFLQGIKKKKEGINQQ